MKKFIKFTYRHSLGSLQKPCSSWHPGKQMAIELNKNKSLIKDSIHNNQDSSKVELGEKKRGIGGMMYVCFPGECFALASYLTNCCTPPYS
jgi:hypothetical protein